MRISGLTEQPHNPILGYHTPDHQPPESRIVVEHVPDGIRLTDPPVDWFDALCQRPVLLSVLAFATIIAFTLVVQTQNRHHTLSFIFFFVCIAVVTTGLGYDAHVRSSQPTVIEVRGRFLTVIRPVHFHRRLRWHADQIASIHATSGIPTLSMQLASDLVLIPQTYFSIHILIRRPKTEVVWLANLLNSALGILPKPSALPS
jgi:hypothetical protein